jgi:exodeoxyribonuclease VII large subunit
MSDRKFFPLSKITERISTILQPAVGKTFWVKAEISSGRERGGSFYCDLVETNDDGKVIAKMSCTIWQRDLSSIRNLFKVRGMDLILTDGTVVGLQCSIQYSPQYGLSLRVVDADPAFALGELELKKRELIERLQKDGIFEQNKKCFVPTLPQRIGLITSQESAAYNDFIKTLKTSGFGFKVYFADAMMQGDQTEKSVLRALGRLLSYDLDVVVLIRGGGSKTDLYYLDNELIARSIAACELPVWTGIGHEIDTSVLDYVANRYFKTPTAVAEDLVARYVEMRRHLDEATARFKSTWSFRLEAEKENMLDANTGLKQGTRKLMDFTAAMLKERAQELSRRVLERISREQLHVAEYRATLQAKPMTVICNLRERVATRLQNLRSLVRNRINAEKIHRDELGKRFQLPRFLNVIQNERRGLQSKSAVLKAADPQTALKRGFALVYREDGALVKSRGQVVAGQTIRTTLADGAIVSTIQTVKGTEE